MRPHGEIPDGPAVGIDRMTLVMPVHSAAPDLRRDRRRQMPVGGAAPVLQLQGQSPNESVRLDLNPAKVDPASTGSLPVGAMAEVIETVASAFDLEKLVELQGPLLKAKLTRLDAACDFAEVPHRQTVFEAQLHLPRRRNGEAHAYSAKDGGISGLVVGGKREFVKLYTRDDGSLRFEVQACRDWLDRAAITGVQDITQERVDALARRRWESSLFGMPVVGMEDMIERVQATDWTDAVKSRLLGDLLRISMGHKPEWSNDRRASFYKRFREIGVAPAHGVLGKGPVHDPARFRHGH